MTNANVPPPRETSTLACTCLIRDIQRNRLQFLEDRDRERSYSLPGSILQSHNDVKKFDLEYPEESSSKTLHANSENGQDQEVEGSRRGQSKREAIGNTGLANMPLRDVFARQLKKRVARSSENKIRELASYKEQLAITLNTLIPPRRPHDPTSAHPPIISPVPHTFLCPACLKHLAHSLYYSQARRSAYLREQSVPAYLSLIDDSVASFSIGLPMERVTHHDLNFILRGELSVVEWRLAIKLARLNQKTAFLDTFPVRIGEYSQMEPVKKPPPEDESMISKVKGKLWTSIGLGGKPAMAAQGPSGESDE